MKIKTLIYNQIYILIPILFGIWSMLLGQDRNQDLSGYHLYNGFSFLFDKFDIDYGVAGMRTYFNPLLDTFFYFFNTNLNPFFFGFLMGFLHGLIFILIFDITTIFLTKYKNKKSPHFIFFVSICCVLTPNFISGLGNSMGDNTTALLNVLAIWTIIKYWSYLKKIGKKTLFILAFSGLVFGISTGLKLTNSIYALALCFSLLMYPTSNKNKFLLSSIFGIFVLFGIFISSGFWFIKLWTHFHNPIFPFFNSIFPNPYSDLSVIDNRWGPNNFIEAIFWPFIFSMNYHRAGEGLIHQFIWPIFYLLLLLILIRIITRNKLIKFKHRLDQKSIFLVGFIAVSFILWTIFFSLQRYLVTIELFVPLGIILFLFHFFSRSQAENIYIKLMLVSLIFILIGGFGTWGHSRWTKPAFKADTPKLIDISESTVFLTNQGMNLSWIVTQFPTNLSFVQLGVLKDFEVKKHLYVMFASAQNWRVGNVKKWEYILNKAGLLDSENECIFVDKLIKRINFRAKFIWNDPLSNSSCHLAIKDGDYIDIDNANNLIIKKNQHELSKYNLRLDKLSCNNYQANIGGQGWNYIFCSVNKSY